MMLEYLKNIDQSVFFFLNGSNNPFLDSMMFQATNTLVWLPLYVFFIFLVIRQYKWQAIPVVVFAAVMILISDQLCNLAKEYFHRFRPSNDPSLPPVHIVYGYRGGAYGFYSSHASNTFAVAMFLIIIAGSQWRFLPFIFISWALLVSYTRIYLGVHFPGDILTGAVMGMIIGYLFGKLCMRAVLVISERIRKKKMGAG